MVNKPYLIKAVFNAANFGGIGAVCLSLGYGTIIGSAIYLFAVLIGSYSKYNSLLGKISKFSKVINDPLLSAKIFMLAGIYNLFFSIINVFNSTGTEIYENIFVSLAWFFGVLGDNSLRKVDKANFSSGIDKLKENVSVIRRALYCLFINPVFFYKNSDINFTLALLLSPDISSVNENIISLVIIAVAAYAVLHPIIITFMVCRGKISEHKINDGVMNYLSALILIGMTILSLIAGNYWFALGSIFFTVTAIKALYETRLAINNL